MLSRLVIFLLLLLIPASVVAETQIGIGISVSEQRMGGGFGGFLFPGSPYAALSTRQVGATATKSLQVERFSDSTTHDIGFVNGAFDVGTFNTFCANTWCFVSKFYDQSGNSRDFSPIGALPSPINASGGIPQIGITNGIPYISWFNSQLLGPAANFPSTGGVAVGVGATSLVSDLQTLAYNNLDASLTGSFLDFNGPGSGGGIGPNQGGVLYFPGAAVYGPNVGVNVMGNQHNTAVTIDGSNNLTFYDGGVAGTTAAGVTNTNPATIATSIGDIRSAPGNFPFQGVGINEFWFYNGTLPSPTDIAKISASETEAWPDLGFGQGYATGDTVAGVMFNFQHNASLNENVALGNVLDYEYTQPWSVSAAIQVYAVTPNAAAIIFTNVPPSVDGTFPGYELWLDGLTSDGVLTTRGCRLRVRIIHNIGAGQYLGVYQTTPTVCDRQKHFVYVTYDGSGLAAGVTIYDNGVAVPLTVEHDGLAGNTIIGAGQNWFIGNQQGSIFPFLGVISHIQLDATTRSAAYVAAHSSPSSLPPIDTSLTCTVSGVANQQCTQMSIKFQDGTGTTATDSSGLGHNGTVSSATQWVP